MQSNLIQIESLLEFVDSYAKRAVHSIYLSANKPVINKDVVDFDGKYFHPLQFSDITGNGNYKSIVEIAANVMIFNLIIDYE